MDRTNGTWLALGFGAAMAAGAALGRRGGSRLTGETRARMEAPVLVRRGQPVEVSLAFERLSKENLEHLFAAERQLNKAGITFDTGYAFPSRTRDWSWDWSLEGPVSVTFSGLPKKKGRGSRTAAPITLGEMATVAVGLRDADFWLPRKGAEAGKPVKTWSADAVGVKVVRTDVLVPKFLFYALEYLWMRGAWKANAVTVGNVRSIPFQPTEGTGAN
jgi:hypothetical protein